MYSDYCYKLYNIFRLNYKVKLSRFDCCQYKGHFEGGDCTT